MLHTRHLRVTEIHGFPIRLRRWKSEFRITIQYHGPVAVHVKKLQHLSDRDFRAALSESL